VICLNLKLKLLNILTLVVYLAEVADDSDEVLVLFLHFLMMTATLFCLSRSYEKLHCFEDFVCPSHMPIHKMLVMYFQKPMIFFVLLIRPMASIDVFDLINSSFAFFDSLSRELLQLMLELLRPIFEQILFDRR